MIYAVISFEYPCRIGDKLEILGAPFFDQHGKGSVYFVAYAGTKAELIEALGLAGDVRLDHVVVSTVPGHRYWDFEGLTQWMERNGIGQGVA